MSEEAPSGESGSDILKELFGLAGQHALVTGGGAGLGREISKMLAAAGATVVVADLVLASAEDTVAAIEAAGGNASAIEMDVADEQSVLAAFDAIDASGALLSILVNNAGIYPSRNLIDMSSLEWDRVHGINARGSFLCTREAARRMKHRGAGGRIINISSIASMHPALIGNAHYASSKAAVNMLTKAAALELAPDRITVNAVLPGGVMSETRKTKMGDTAEWAGPATDSSRFLLGLGHPTRHASAVLFLAGEGGGHITGQTLVVDGGFLIS